MATFATNASGAMLLPNLVTESISGSVVPLAMFTVSMLVKCLASARNLFF